MSESVLTELPSLDRDYAVPAEAIAEYDEKGHTILRGLASTAEITAYEPVIREAAFRHNKETRPIEERDDIIAKALLQIWNLWTLDEAARRFTLARRFAKVAAELMGVDGVRIFHDQALFKESGAIRTPWHQDQFFWPLDSDKMITMWMPLVDVPAEIGGTMSFVSGSQKLGYLGDFPISEESDAAFAKMIEDTGLTVDTHGAAGAGDATFHSGWSLHMAPANPTGNLREVMTIIYFADGMRVSEPENDAQQVDLERWLPGLQPGDLANSELNPLVYSRNA
jgi:ectoine hydroxylase-related dioxygenase (phytanoyl-CoA dioxygenase family)